MSKRESFNDTIVRVCAEHYKATVEDVRSDSRSYQHGAVQARFMVCWILRRHYGLTYEQIAKHLKRGDHTTVLYAVRKMDDFFSVYADLRNDRKEIMDRLNIKTLFD